MTTEKVVKNLKNGSKVRKTLKALSRHPVISKTNATM